jgi:hypothetical protein
MISYNYAIQAIMENHIIELTVVRDVAIQHRPGRASVRGSPEKSIGTTDEYILPIK